MRFGKRLWTSTFVVLSLAAVPGFAQVRHFEYVFPDGFIYVYDLDNNFALVKTIPVPTTAGTRGTVASAATGMLYISYGSDGSDPGSMLKYDLVKDQVVWTTTFSVGIDSMSLSPDGTIIYMPTGEVNSGGIWSVVDAGSGKVTGSIDTGGTGPHNTYVNATGTHVYMGARNTNYLFEADTASFAILRKIGPISTAGDNGVRPFVVNASETLAFITATGLLGFQVGDVATGKILYNASIQGFTWTPGGITAPSHGISISPDEKEIYVMDAPNSYVHVYDISGLPGAAPKQVADIPLTGKVTGSEQGCAYDCAKDGWLHHSRDGRFVFVGDSGDVIDTVSRKTVGNLPALANTRKMIEIDFQNGVPVWAMYNRNSPGGNLTRIANGASYAAGPIAPGEVVYLSGVALGPPKLEAGGSTKVLFDGASAPVIYASSTQTSAIVPYEIASKTTTTVEVSYKGILSNPMSMRTAAVAPGLFTTDSSGTGQGAILNQDNTRNSAANPAEKGSIVQIFGTGQGLTDPPVTTGALVDGIHIPLLAVTATIGGKPAVVQFAGSAPGLIAGILQVNLAIPDDASSGDNAVVVKIGDSQTQDGVTVAVK